MGTDRDNRQTDKEEADFCGLEYIRKLVRRRHGLGWRGFDATTSGKTATRRRHDHETSYNSERGTEKAQVPPRSNRHPKNEGHRDQWTCKILLSCLQSHTNRYHSLQLPVSKYTQHSHSSSPPVPAQLSPYTTSNQHLQIQIPSLQLCI